MSSDELIKSVRNYKCLYDYKDRGYKDLNTRMEAWKEIGQQLKLPAEKCKDNWTKLRNAYLSAINRRKTKPGQADWRYEKQMKFLRSYMKTKRTETDLMPPESPISATDYFDESHSSFSQASRSSIESRRSSTLERKPDIEDTREIMTANNDLRQQRQPPYQEMDDTDLFFLSMSKAVKALPKMDQIKVKLDLHKAVSQAEIRKIMKEDGN